MKHILPLLLLVVSLQACGQSKDVIAHNSSGTVREVNGTGIPAMGCEAKDIGQHLFLGSHGAAEALTCDAKSLVWTEDKAAEKAEEILEAKEAAERRIVAEHHKALALALISRVLTEKEMAEVVKLGTGVFDDHSGPQFWGSFNNASTGDEHTAQYAHDYYLEKRFSDGVLQQFKLRAIAAEHRPTPRLSDRCAKFYAENPTSLVNCNSGDPPHSGIQPIMPQMDAVPFFGGPAVPPIQTVCKVLPEGGTTCTQTGLAADPLNRCGIDIGATGCSMDVQ